jgi:hypothetical protein
MLAILAVAIALYFLAVCLLVHYGFTHRQDPPDSPAKDDGLPWLCLFQPKDVTNHATWVLVCLTNAVTLTAVALAR